MRKQSDYDVSIAVRTAITAAVVSTLLALLGKLPGVSVSAEVAAGVGAIVGILYDSIAFFLKSRVNAWWLSGTMMMCFVAPLPASAQSPEFTYSSFFDSRTRQLYQVAVTPIGTVRDVLGKQNWSLSVKAFAGVGNLGKPIAGIALLDRRKLATNVYLEYGPAVTVTASRATGVGIFAGVSYRF